MASLATPQGSASIASFAAEFDRSHRALQLQHGGSSSGSGAGSGSGSGSGAVERARRRKEAEGIQQELGMLAYQAQELDVALQAVTKQNLHMLESFFAPNDATLRRMFGGQAIW